MALIKCPECGRDVSTAADACPHCGYPIAKMRIKETKNELHAETIEEKQNDKIVIAKRGDSGSALSISAICLVIGLGLIIAFSVLMFTVPSARSAFIAGIILGCLAIVLPCIDIVRFVKNWKNPNHCVLFDSKSKKFHLFTINGKEIIIDAADYVEVKDNFATSNLLYFTYRDSNNGLKKVNLGYCANRNQIRANIDRVLKSNFE